MSGIVRQRSSARAASRTCSTERSQRGPTVVDVNVPTISEVDAIGAMGDPVLRNLRITQCYHELSAAIAERGRVTPRRVVKKDGQTWFEGLRLTGEFDDND